MAHRVLALLLFGILLTSSCRERDEFFRPDLPDQDITLELADGTTLRYTELRSSANESALAYRFDPADPEPGNIFLSRAGAELSMSVDISGAFPLDSTDFDAEGFLRVAAMVFPREAELRLGSVQEWRYCSWSTTVRFESWSESGILSGSFTNTNAVSCPQIPAGIIGGSFSVYVTPFREN